MTLNNGCRTTMVCIDSYRDGVLQGRMYNPFLQEGVSFESTMDFLNKTQDLMEQMQFPQEFSKQRAFRPRQERALLDTVVNKGMEGKLATFALRVLFRQNASWQGSVIWCEGNQEESYRSVLELLMLFDSALREAA